MSKRKPQKNISRHRQNDKDRTNGLIGYGNPPREHTFKPGQSGNPKGRRKGSKNESTILCNRLQKQIEIREGGRSRRISVLEAIVLRIIEDSLKGNVKSAAFLLNRYGTVVTGEVTSTPIDDDTDQEVLDGFVRRITGKGDQS